MSQADRHVNDALRARFAEVQEQYVRMRDGLSGLQQQLGELEVSATSRDELITATVNARGHLVRLTIDPRAFREGDPERLAESITATTRQAATEAADRAAAVMASVLPASSGAPAFVRSGDFGDLLSRLDARHGYDPQDHGDHNGR